MFMQEVILNWSSGKDAALAFYYLSQSDAYRVAGLLTSISAGYKRVSMHGIAEEILDMQARYMDIPLRKIYLPENADMQAYNNIMSAAVTDIKAAGIDTMAFGDIFLEDLKKYREEQLATAGMKAVFPLWKKDTASLVQEVEDCGIKAMIVCVNEQNLGKEFLGRYIGRELLKELPAGVDPCGEHGEFHTLVVDAPYFKTALPVATGEIVHRAYRLDEHSQSGFYFLDVQVV
jgi:uncharacterized protein (TIGR00290 family)